MYRDSTIALAHRDGKYCAIPGGPPGQLPARLPGLEKDVTGRYNKPYRLVVTPNFKYNSTMKTYILLLLACISISNSLYSQKFKKPIDYRFKNGENGYVSFFSKNINFPVPAIKNGTIGNSIIRISLNPKGEINEINIINPIDSTIDNEVLRVIYLSKSLWKECDTINQDDNKIFNFADGFSLDELNKDQD
ncbi:MAG: hypothetical protein NTX93_02375 [Bacteroidia bacterium]|nr:hypothetical protein [Bacteroidia bacterium]